MINKKQIASVWADFVIPGLLASPLFTAFVHHNQLFLQGEFCKKYGLFIFLIAIFCWVRLFNDTFPHMLQWIPRLFFIMAPICIIVINTSNDVRFFTCLFSGYFTLMWVTFFETDWEFKPEHEKKIKSKEKYTREQYKKKYKNTQWK
jgi:hypothetical protein